ncbi:MAG: c-type cytochrome domain-containing protein [Verrucomicrobiales bacterium]
MKLLSLILPLAGLAGSLPALDYERDIMPIFEKKCGDCHGKDSEKVKGGLKLDDPEHFHQRFGKNSVVVPGDWDASYLFISLFRPEGHDDAMPPKGKGERLTPEEVVLVQQWIADGAPINGERGERGEMPGRGDPGYVETGEPAGEPDSKPEPRQWTNREGKSITATLVGVEGEEALLRTSNGTVHRYPVAKLSEASRAALAE